MPVSGNIYRRSGQVMSCFGPQEMWQNVQAHTVINLLTADLVFGGSKVKATEAHDPKINKKSRLTAANKNKKSSSVCCFLGPAGDSGISFLRFHNWQCGKKNGWSAVIRKCAIWGSIDLYLDSLESPATVCLLRFSSCEKRLFPAALLLSSSPFIPHEILLSFFSSSNDLDLSGVHLYPNIFTYLCACVCVQEEGRTNVWRCRNVQRLACRNKKNKKDRHTRISIHANILTTTAGTDSQ